MSNQPSILGPLAPKQETSKEDFKAGCFAIVGFLVVLAVILAAAYWNYTRVEAVLSR